MSNAEKKKVPAAPTPPAAAGNLLSSVAPPSELPNFVTANPMPVAAQVPPIAPSMLPPVATQPVQAPSSGTNEVVPPSSIQLPSLDSPSQDKFSPAIPLSKGEPMHSIRSPEDSLNTQSPESLPASTPEVDQLGDIMPGSGLFTWVKGAVSTGILQRVAEKAKSSVDSMITTLDPQMKEYLYSGGDMYVVVASDKDVKISPVREAFQAVFGKATIVGIAAQSEVTAIQPVGYAAAYAAAKQRIAHLRSTNPDIHNNVPIVAIDSFLHEPVTDKWFDISLLVLSQPSLGIELVVQSMASAVPAAAALAARAATPPDYEHAATGYAVTIGSIMAASLQISQIDGFLPLTVHAFARKLCKPKEANLFTHILRARGYAVTIGSIMAASLQVPHTQWQEAATGVSRKEILLLAAKALAGSFKKMLAVSANET